MEKKIDKLFSSTAGLLTFALFSGTGYFFMILRLIMSYSKNQSTLLGFFFAPAIICGIGLFIVKTVKNNKEAEELKKNNILFFFHVLVIILGLIFLADIIF